jgi:large repetitive protein
MSSMRPSIWIVLAAVAGAAGAACSLMTLDGFSCQGASCHGDETLDTSLGDAGADAQTASDDIGLGDGHFGSKQITGEEVVNSYAAITADVAAGATSIEIENAAPIPGDAVLVWQTVSRQSIANAEPIDLAAYDAGFYQVVRVTNVGAGANGAAKLELARPLEHAFEARGGQVVRIAEYTDLTVVKNAKLKAQPWDGRRGGIVAIFVNGSLRVDGAIDVDGAGLRGGVTYLGPFIFNCGMKLDGQPAAGYAAKGEGLVTALYRAASDGDPASAPGGRGNSTTGGGGGHCHNSGAGGGGNGGSGGNGGREWTETGDGGANGGLGGSALVYSVKQRLVLGGGGGAGERHDRLDTSGARGGGAVFARARSLDVTGTIHANGATAISTDHDGAGGGGAGGTLAFFVTEQATCESIVTANGGNGGSSTYSYVGPGGGGGGGHVFLRTATSNCMLEAKSGICGVQGSENALGGIRYGATPEIAEPGVIEAP